MDNIGIWLAIIHLFAAIIVTVCKCVGVCAKSHEDAGEAQSGREAAQNEIAGAPGCEGCYVSDPSTGIRTVSGRMDSAAAGGGAGRSAAAATFEDLPPPYAVVAQQGYNKFNGTVPAVPTIHPSTVSNSSPAEMAQLEGRGTGPVHSGGVGGSTVPAGRGRVSPSRGGGLEGRCSPPPPYSIAVTIPESGAR